jgi:predicted kinase
MATLILIRGLPGAGKSTAMRRRGMSAGAVCLSADDFFLLRQGEALADAGRQIPWGKDGCEGFTYTFDFAYLS